MIPIPSDLSTPTVKNQVFAIIALKESGVLFIAYADYLARKVTRTWTDYNGESSIDSWMPSRNMPNWVERIRADLEENGGYYEIDLYDFVSDINDMKALDTRPAF